MRPALSGARKVLREQDSVPGHESLSAGAGGREGRGADGGVGDLRRAGHSDRVAEPGPGPADPSAGPGRSRSRRTRVSGRADPRAAGPARALPLPCLWWVLLSAHGPHRDAHTRAHMHTHLLCSNPQCYFLRVALPNLSQPFQSRTGPLSAWNWHSSLPAPPPLPTLHCSQCARHLSSVWSGTR